MDILKISFTHENWTTPKLTIYLNPIANWQATCIVELARSYEGNINYELQTEEHKNKGDLVFAPFINGRERGYTVYYDGKEVNFAENRNSDQIVVYPFKWQGVPEKEFFEKRRYLAPHEFYEALKGILTELGLGDVL